MNKQVWSECCLSSVRVYSGEEGTNHYICNACNEACDVTDRQTSAQSNKGDTNDIDDIFRRLEERVEYNRHDMGEMGMFIRVGYVKNFLEDTKAIVQKWAAQETNKAAINELKHLEGGTDYWLDNGEVVKVSDRIKALTADKEQA